MFAQQCVKKKIFSKKIPRGRLVLPSFTLLELVLVVLLLGMLVAVSFPVVKKNVDRAGFKTFVSKVYFFLDYARTQSVFKNTTYEIVLDFDAARLLFRPYRPQEEENAPIPEESILAAVIIPEGFTIESEAEKLLFYPDGTMEKFLLTIRGSDEYQEHIRSEGLDGTISIGEEP